MRLLAILALLAPCAALTAQDAPAPSAQVRVLPDAVYVEEVGGNLIQTGRLFFHIVVHNQSARPIDVQWIRFDIVNLNGGVVSGQFSGKILQEFFDASIASGRIEPTATGTNVLGADERKAVTDVFMSLPSGFIGQSMVIGVEYKSGEERGSSTVSIPLHRSEGLMVRLPFDGVWYVSGEHGPLDPHKRIKSEIFGYDFTQIGTNGKSYRTDGVRNADYFAYRKKAVAARAGRVVFVRNNVAENIPGERPPRTVPPGGNVVVLDHGNNRYTYYAHLRPDSIDVKAGDTVRAAQPIGEVGNSGNSSEPHLHFHVMNNPDPDEADGLPVVFESWKSESYRATGGVARQQGILPKGEFVQP